MRWRDKKVTISPHGVDILKYLPVLSNLQLCTTFDRGGGEEKRNAEAHESLGKEAMAQAPSKP